MLLRDIIPAESHLSVFTVMAVGSFAGAAAGFLILRRRL